MPNERVFAMSYAGVYPHFVNIAVGKGRTEVVVTNVSALLTGCTHVKRYSIESGTEFVIGS